LARHLDPQRFVMEAWFFGEEGPLARELEAVSVTTRVLPFPVRSAGAISRTWRELRSSPADVIHLHLWSRAVRWIAAMSGKKLLLQLHARVSEHGESFLRRIPTRGADAVIAVSEAVARHAAGVAPIIVYPGVDAAEAPPAAPIVPTVGTACRLVPIKGLTSLLTAISLVMNDVPRVVVEIAGAGPERQSLGEEAARLGLAERVHFLGWLPQPREAMQRWSIFVQASRDEGFPIAALEAMASGIPVVAMGVGGLPELVRNGRTGWLVPAGDVAALADKISQLLREPDRAREMGRAALEDVRQRFSPARMSAAVGYIYERLANQ
jgi:glycosyltransferase involved in cell wall biosynthesis